MRGRKLTITVADIDAPTSYALGSTMSVENHRVVNNAIVLEKVDREQHLGPSLLTYRNKQFFKVPQEIRDYLAQWRLSYMKTPTQLDSLESLAQTTDQNSRPDKRTLTVSPGKPIVYIATPFSSLTKDKSSRIRYIDKMKVLSSIIKELEVEFGQIGIDVEFRLHGRLEEPEPSDATHDIIKQDYLLSKALISNTFEELSYVKYFILVYDENVASRSLIEFGAAIQSCTICSAIYEENSGFPDSVRTLAPRDGFKPLRLQDFRGSVADEKDRIKRFIETTIVDFY